MAYGTLNAGTITPGSGNTLTINETVTHTGAVTLPSPVINTGVSGTAILDEDAMGSDSATQLATQQSIKAYVDSAASQATTAAQGVGTGDSPSFGALTLSTGNLRFSNSANKGIDFQDYVASGTRTVSSNGNILDDYEEGTWSPVPSFSTTDGYSNLTGNGTYTKIGRLVTASFLLSFDKGTSAGIFIITGLPFTVLNSASARSGLAISYLQRIGKADYVFTGYSVENNTTIQPYFTGQASSNTVTSVTNTNISASTASVIATVTYHAT
jgi:hypothetical protein